MAFGKFNIISPPPSTEAPTYINVYMFLFLQSRERKSERLHQSNSFYLHFPGATLVGIHKYQFRHLRYHLRNPPRHRHRAYNPHHPSLCHDRRHHMLLLRDPLSHHRLPNPIPLPPPIPHVIDPERVPLATRPTSNARGQRGHRRTLRIGISPSRHGSL